MEPTPEHLAREEKIRQKLAPLEQARAIFDLARGQDREVLAARADVYSEVGRRIFLLGVEQAGLYQAGEVWLSPADLEALTEGPGAALPAWTDAMFADCWRHVWCAEEDRLRLWSRRRLLLEAGKDAATLAPGLLRRGRTVAASGLRHVHGWLAGDWVKRGIDLVPEEGPPVTVVSYREMAAIFDVTYDGLDLLCDAAWVRDLAHAMGETLGLPVELDEDL